MYKRRLYTRLSKEYLSHHGVEGQKWGVRRGPPYPIEDQLLKKGTKLNSVRAFKDWTHSNTVYTFNPDDEWDTKVYKGPYAYYMRFGRHMPDVYEHRYEVVKDLKMPTKQDRQDAFVKIYNENKNVTIKELKKVQKLANTYGAGSENARKINLRNLKTPEDYAVAYELFNHLMENAKAYTSTREYIKLMESNFDAMVDDNNQGIYNSAHDPVIIFRAREALKEIGEARLVDANEIVSNYISVSDELAKEGKIIKL